MNDTIKEKHILSIDSYLIEGNHICNLPQLVFMQVDIHPIITIDPISRKFITIAIVWDFSDSVGESLKGLNEFITELFRRVAGVKLQLHIFPLSMREVIGEPITELSDIIPLTIDTLSSSKFIDDTGISGSFLSPTITGESITNGNFDFVIIATDGEIWDWEQIAICSKINTLRSLLFLFFEGMAGNEVATSRNVIRKNIEELCKKDGISWFDSNQKLVSYIADHVGIHETTIKNHPGYNAKLSIPGLSQYLLYQKTDDNVLKEMNQKNIFVTIGENSLGYGSYVYIMPKIYFDKSDEAKMTVELTYRESTNSPPFSYEILLNKSDNANKLLEVKKDLKRSYRLLVQKPFGWFWNEDLLKGLINKALSKHVLPIDSKLLFVQCSVDNKIIDPKKWILQDIPTVCCTCGQILIHQGKLSIDSEMKIVNTVAFLVGFTLQVANDRFESAQKNLYIDNEAILIKNKEYRGDNFDLMFNNGNWQLINHIENISVHTFKTTENTISYIDLKNDDDLSISSFDVIETPGKAYMFFIRTTM